MKIKATILLLVAVLLVGGWQFWKSQFRLDNIIIKPLFFTPVEVLSPEQIQEYQQILNQSFHYLGQGNQCYVFESADEQYVLKFFKLKRAQGGNCNHTEDWANKKNARNFHGYRLAYEKDKENSALLYSHLMPTNFLKLTIPVKDRFGWTHKINLDEVVFVLQRKGETSKKVISRLLNERNTKAVKECFRAMLDMYAAMYRQGIYDRDHNIMINTGFIGKQPFRIDLGKLRADEKMKNPDHFKKDLEKVALKRIDRWLKNYHPQYRDEICADLEKKIQEITS